jgi:hypothetical protein
MSALTSASSPGGNAILDAARPAFVAAIWAYFNQHQGDVVFSKWFISVRLGQLRSVFVAIAGEDPNAPR